MLYMFIWILLFCEIIYAIWSVCGGKGKFKPQAKEQKVKLAEKNKQHERLGPKELSTNPKELIDVSSKDIKDYYHLDLEYFWAELKKWYRDVWIRQPQQGYLKMVVNSPSMGNYFKEVPVQFFFMEWEKVKSFYTLAPEKWSLVPYYVPNHGTSFNEPPYLRYIPEEDGPQYIILLTLEDYLLYLEAVNNYSCYQVEVARTTKFTQSQQSCAECLSYIQKDIDAVREKAQAQMQAAAETTLEVAKKLENH